ncbi:MAG: hypothetical protein ACLQDY_23755 [Streptosporangiaceae bacterium]
MTLSAALVAERGWGKEAGETGKDVMGGMMGAGGMGAWLVFWTVLGVAVLVAAGVVAARIMSGGHRTELPSARGGQLSNLDEARAALRMRYANGEISREDYLQGKVELED